MYGNEIYIYIYISPQELCHNARVTMSARYARQMMLRTYWNEKRPVHMKRDLSVWRKWHRVTMSARYARQMMLRTYWNEQRPVHMKRDLSVWKETYPCEENEISKWKGRKMKHENEMSFMTRYARANSFPYIIIVISFACFFFFSFGYFLFSSRIKVSFQTDKSLFIWTGLFSFGQVSFHFHRSWTTFHSHVSFFFLFIWTFHFLHTDRSLFTEIGLFSFGQVSFHFNTFLTSFDFHASWMKRYMHTYGVTPFCTGWIYVFFFLKNVYISDAYMHCGATRNDVSCHNTGIYAWDIHASCFSVNAYSISTHIEWCYTASMLVWCHTHQESGCVWHDSWMCVTWRMGMCDMTHGCVWHDSWICVTWLMNSATLHTSNPRTSRVKMCVTWLMDVCDMTHRYVWHDSWMCVVWLMNMYDMTHEFCHLTHFESTHIKSQDVCDMTHGCVWHDS